MINSVAAGLAPAPAAEISPQLVKEIVEGADASPAAKWLGEPPPPPLPTGQHAAAAGAGRLVLTHLDPGKDPAQNLAGARDAFPGPVTLAAPGQVIDLALGG